MSTCSCQAFEDVAAFPAFEELMLKLKETGNEHIRWLQAQINVVEMPKWGYWMWVSAGSGVEKRQEIWGQAPQTEEVANAKTLSYMERVMLEGKRLLCHYLIED